MSGPTDYGFKWGPLDVIRVAEFEPRKGRKVYVLQIATDGGQAVNIYVSAKGRSLRVFRDGVKDGELR